MRRVSVPGRTARVVIVGAGASRLVDALLADGHGVVAVDIALGALDALAARLQDADEPIASARLQFVVADVRELRLDEQVDVWHDRAVFHFLVDPADRSAYVTAASSAVRPGGHLVIATFAPSGPDTCSGLPVERHDRGSIAAAFSSHFDLLDAWEADHRTPWGTSQRFTHAVLRRHAV